jgi:hypothetical protein
MWRKDQAARAMSSTALAARASAAAVQPIEV